MSEAEGVLASTAQTGSGVASLAVRQGPPGTGAGRRAVDQGGGSRSRHLCVRGEWSGSRPWFGHPCGERPCVEPSRDWEAHGAFICDGTQCSPLGGMHHRVTPTAAPPGAHGAPGGACDACDLACALASRTRAGEAASDPMPRRARLGRGCSRGWGETGVDALMGYQGGTLCAGVSLCSPVCHTLAD